MTPEQEKEIFNSREFVLQGRIFHPNLISKTVLTEQEIAAGKKPQYKCQFAWPKNAAANAQTMQNVFAFLNEMKEKIFPTIPWTHFVYPVKDFDTYVRQDGKPNGDHLRDHYWMNPTTMFDFCLVDQNKNPVFNEADVYSGRNALLSFTFYKSDGQKKGFGVNIRAIMLLEGGEKLGGVAPVDPNQAFGNFAIDSNLIAQGGQAPQQTVPGMPTGAPAPAPAPQTPPPIPGQQAAPQAPQMPGNFGAPGQQPAQPAAPQAPTTPQAPTAPGAPQTQYGQQNAGGGYAPPASPSNPFGAPHKWGAPGAGNGNPIY